MSALERYAEWLARTDIPITDIIAIMKGQLTLMAALQGRGINLNMVSTRQIQALFNTMRYEYNILTKYGISPVVGQFVIGPAVRWTIEGKPGLWSTQSIQKMFNLRPRL